jgi:hypothetical protein
MEGKSGEITCRRKEETPGIPCKKEGTPGIRGKEGTQGIRGKEGRKDGRAQVHRWDAAATTRAIMPVSLF